ncbi:MAG: hypothetical protein ACTHOO_01365 [Alcanivorax sp.]
MSESNPNEAGYVYVANVTLTEAAVFDPQQDDPDAPETWEILGAEDFDKVEHKSCEFYCAHCLDNGDKVRLKKPSGERIQELPFETIDPRTNEAVLDENNEPVIETRRYLFPPHFSTWAGEEHKCDVVKHQSQLNTTLQDLDGIKLNPDSDITILNLGISAGQQKVRRRPFVHLTDDQFNPKSGQGHAQPPLRQRLHRSSKAAPSKLSRGVSDVHDLAKVLDDTEFDKGKRQSIVLRNGSQLVSLEQLHNGNTLDLYRDLYATETKIADNPDANHNHMALFRFRPNGNRKFWKREKDGSMTVPSQPEQIRDKDGDLFYVTAKINFQTEKAFDDFNDAYSNAKNASDRWFLVYTENANINIYDHAQKKLDLQEGRMKHAEVGVSTTVFNSSQMMQWTPRDPQLLFSFAQKPETPNQHDDLEMT